MSINGWIRILSIIFQVDVAKRLDAVAINYDALNDVLGVLGERKTRVLELTIGAGMSRKNAAAALNALKANKTMLHLIHRAVSGWWNLTEPDIHPLPSSVTPRHRKAKVQSASCLVITNFNKSRVRTKTVTVTKEVVQRVEVEKKVFKFREPRWHDIAAELPQHGGRVVAMDWSDIKPLEAHDGAFQQGRMWLSIFDALARAFVCGDGVTRTTITHWCELPKVQSELRLHWNADRGLYD